MRPIQVKSHHPKHCFGESGIRVKVTSRLTGCISTALTNRKLLIPIQHQLSEHIWNSSPSNPPRDCRQKNPPSYKRGDLGLYFQNKIDADIWMASNRAGEYASPIPQPKYVCVMATSGTIAEMREHGYLVVIPQFVPPEINITKLTFNLEQQHEN